MTHLGTGAWFCVATEVSLPNCLKSNDAL
jgi:hypothetical protein